MNHPSQWIASGMTCREVIECTPAYLDDRSSVLRTIRMGFHLVSCAHCRMYVKQIRMLCDAVRLLPQPVVPAITRLNLRRRFTAHFGGRPAGDTSPACLH